MKMLLKVPTLKKLAYFYESFDDLYMFPFCMAIYHPQIHEGFEPDFIYARNIVKKIIIDVESNHGIVVDGLYEQLAHYMSSFQVSLARNFCFLFHCFLIFSYYINRLSV